MPVYYQTMIAALPSVIRRQHCRDYTSILFVFYEPQLFIGTSLLEVRQGIKVVLLSSHLLQRGETY